MGCMQTTATKFMLRAQPCKGPTRTRVAGGEPPRPRSRTMPRRPCAGKCPPGHGCELDHLAPGAWTPRHPRPHARGSTMSGPSSLSTPMPTLAVRAPSGTRSVLLDTETTGLDPSTGDRVIEIAAIELQSDLPTGRVFHVVLDPERDVPEEATRVHGFTRDEGTARPSDDRPPSRGRSSDGGGVTRSCRRPRGGSCRGAWSRSP